MPTYERVGLPGCSPVDSKNEVTAEIGRWIRSRPLRDLVAEFGGMMPDAETADTLAYLDAFSADHWDFRRRTGLNVERDRVPVLDFSDSQAALIHDVAGALGMIDAESPSRRSYTHLLILGGLAPACLQRTSYAAGLVSRIAVGHVFALGSFRPLGQHEVDFLRHFSPETSEHEVDAMDIGVRRAFGYGSHQEEYLNKGTDPNLSKLIRTYREPGAPVVDVLAAPSTEPAVRRANTADTYDFWARTVTLSPTDWVLVVTSPIYVPFQHFDAKRMLGLPSGCRIETVGFDPTSITEPMLQQTFGPERYLQEIRSAVRSADHLVKALMRSGNGGR